MHAALHSLARHLGTYTLARLQRRTKRTRIRSHKESGVERETQRPTGSGQTVRRVAPRRLHAHECYVPLAPLGVAALRSSTRRGRELSRAAAKKSVDEHCRRRATAGAGGHRASLCAGGHHASLCAALHRVPLFGGSACRLSQLRRSCRLHCAIACTAQRAPPIARFRPCRPSRATRPLRSLPGASTTPRSSIWWPHRASRNDVGPSFAPAAGLHTQVHMGWIRKSATTHVEASTPAVSTRARGGCCCWRGGCFARISA